MKKLNNVDLEALEKTSKGIQDDPSKGKRTNGIQGVWNLQEGMPQFSSEITFEGGNAKLEADQPTFLGGGGTKPGPMHYCLYGLASCYTATFASVAASEGVELEELKGVAEADVNFSKSLGLSDDPIIEEVRLFLSVKGDIAQERLEELSQMAEERCPAVYCMSNPIKFKTEVTKEIA